MEPLSQIAANQARKLNRRPDLPGWWPLLGGLLGVFLVIWVFIHLISPPSTPSTSLGGAASSLGSGGSPGALGTSTGGGTAVTRPASPPSSTTTTTPRVSVATADGGTATVPQAALSLADRSALAFYTTNFAGIPLAPGATKPTLTAAYPDAKVLSTSLSSGTGSPYVFAVTVDPQPGVSGDPGPHVLSVTVSQSGGQWEFVRGG